MRLAGKPPSQLPTDCGPLARLVYPVDEAAAMFGKAPAAIRAGYWEPELPYRLETTWGPNGRRFRRMVFSKREVSALLDHYAPPVNQALDTAATQPLPASHDDTTRDARR